MKHLLFVFICLVSQISFASNFETSVFKNDIQKSDIITPAKGVIQRLIGPKVNKIDFQTVLPINGFETFEITAKNGKLRISGSSTVAICYAFNTYLKEACGSMATWSGKHINLPSVWPDYEKKQS